MKIEMQELIDEVRNTPLVFARFFEKPKCKPWDIVKGRRFGCCHGAREHMRFCMSGVKTLRISKIASLSAKDLTNEN